MDEIYANVDYDKSVKPRPSTDKTGPASSGRGLLGAVVLSLGLLSIFLLAGLIGLGVHHSDSTRRAAAQLSTVKANLTELLRDSDNKLSFLTEERDLLKTNLTEMKQELHRLKNACPEGWRLSRCVCYLLSDETGPWEKALNDCKNRGAQLVVIGSAEEQKFLSSYTAVETFAWMGLTDREKEGTWKWINGATLSSNEYWRNAQPDDGGRGTGLGEEDCAHIISGINTEQDWNDLSCNYKMKWICEKSVNNNAGVRKSL